jgi:hypothetical protein
MVVQADLVAVVQEKAPIDLVMVALQQLDRDLMAVVEIQLVAVVVEEQVKPEIQTAYRWVEMESPL